MLVERNKMVVPMGTNSYGKTKKMIQEACNRYNTYPYRIARTNNSIVIIFAKGLDVPEYIFCDKMFSIMNHLKVSLNLETVILRKSIVKKNAFPKCIRNIYFESCKMVSDETSRKYKEDSGMLDGYSYVKERSNIRKDMLQDGYKVTIDISSLFPY